VTPREFARKVFGGQWPILLPALILIAALLFVGIWPKSLSTAVDGALKPVPQVASK